MRFRTILLCAFIATLLYGCSSSRRNNNRWYTPPSVSATGVIFFSSPPTATGSVSPLDLLFARNPPNSIQNDPFQSLYITVINRKSNTIVNVHLDSSVYDILFFTAQIHDFQKEENVVFPFSFSQRIVSGTKRQSISANAYKLSYQSENTIDSLGKEHLFYDMEVRSFYDDLFYSYSGKLINDVGTEVSFWGQTDPVGPYPISSVVSICSYLSTKRKPFFDFCTKRKNKMEQLCKDQGKKMYVKLAPYPKPLLKIGDFSVGDNLIRDCDVICMPR